MVKRASGVLRVAGRAQVVVHEGLFLVAREAVHLSVDGPVVLGHPQQLALIEIPLSDQFVFAVGGGL